MADVFISYARVDMWLAQQFAELLRENGFDVWLDRDIPPGKLFIQEIDDRLRCAKAVLVLWTHSSVRSPWVRDEAAIARFLGKIVPVAYGAFYPVRGHTFIHYLRAEDIIVWKDDPPEPHRTRRAARDVLTARNSLTLDDKNRGRYWEYELSFAPDDSEDQWSPESVLAEAERIETSDDKRILLDRLRDLCGK